MSLVVPDGAARQLPDNVGGVPAERLARDRATSGIGLDAQPLASRLMAIRYAGLRGTLFQEYDWNDTWKAINVGRRTVGDEHNRPDL